MTLSKLTTLLAFAVGWAGAAFAVDPLPASLATSSPSAGSNAGSFATSASSAQSSSGSDAGSSGGSSATGNGSSAGAELPAADPNYRLNEGDTISVSVFGEPELGGNQVIDRSGNVRLPLLDEVAVLDKTVREAEHHLENVFRERNILRDATVTIRMAAYAPREVSVLGAVRSPGTVSFPRDVTSLDIVDVITRVGGFLPISKTDAVTISRRDEDGRETVRTVDLKDVISGRRKRGTDRAQIEIIPGDRIWVPERLF